MSTLHLIKQTKAAGEDFEWYPTTKEILSALADDLQDYRQETHWGNYVDSILDVGAGNGKALDFLSEKLNSPELCAIEKSRVLISQLPDEVFVIGTDFTEQSLFDKEIEVTFSNPPYSYFEEWSAKIIRESQSRIIYLVLPERWQVSETIMAALEDRNLEAETVGNFDFLSSEDRKARAKVHLIRIPIPAFKADAFQAFIEREFSHLQDTLDDLAEVNESRREKRLTIVEGGDFVSALVSLYNSEQERMQTNYKKMLELDGELLEGLEINLTKICTLLRLQIKNLKLTYWRLLFDRFDEITNRLTEKNRNALQSVLMKNAQVDFTEENVLAIVLWVAKNANNYVNGQLTTIFEQMVRRANVVLYKSNQRIFNDEGNGWRFRQEYQNGRITNIALDYRIVVENHGGISGSFHTPHWSAEGLSERATTFLKDLGTVAHNLGFLSPSSPHDLGRWTSGKKMDFLATRGNETKRFMEVKAYNNGNLHIRFSKDFAMALNVEYGRLKGWLLSAEDAVEELGDCGAKAFFKANHQLSLTNLLPA